MVTYDGPAGAARRKPTERQRYLAAKIRVSADEKLNLDTPAWILELATDSDGRFAS